ncbi:MAG: toluene tolerance protein [Ponticaulis sp.]|nr:toluene tolerance protein [Ponticaulis sp.]|tara:strand:+ start:16403 stop:17092 length:690 start_codon:yes stop_codon:yes gene_type:complete
MTLRFKALALSAGLILATGLPAFADKATEDFVRKNANLALASLNDPNLTHDQRSVEFQRLMNQFTDIERLSRFVIGKYARRFSDADMATYKEAYSRYALAVYEAQLDQYRGNEVVVTGSVDRSDSDSIVDSVIERPQGDLHVKWRVLKDDDNAEVPYQVVDVALDLDGNLPWLAIEQRAQFLSLLDRNNGSAAGLIAKINEMTDKLKAEARANRTAAAGGTTGVTSNAG